MKVPANYGLRFYPGRDVKIQFSHSQSLWKLKFWCYFQMQVSPVKCHIKSRFITSLQFVVCTFISTKGKQNNPINTLYQTLTCSYRKVSICKVGILSLIYNNWNIFLSTFWVQNLLYYQSLYSHSNKQGNPCQFMMIADWH